MMCASVPSGNSAIALEERLNLMGDFAFGIFETVTKHSATLGTNSATLVSTTAASDTN
jgi:hypothetical protein